MYFRTPLSKTKAKHHVRCALNLGPKVHHCAKKISYYFELLAVVGRDQTNSTEYAPADGEDQPESDPEVYDVVNSDSDDLTPAHGTACEEIKDQIWPKSRCWITNSIGQGRRTRGAKDQKGN